MKPPGGLALIIGTKGPPKGGPPEPDGDEATEPDGDEGGGSEKEYARLAAEAIADKDTDSAADALVSMVKACLANYGGKG